MNKSSIENHLHNALSQATPNILDEILSGAHPQDPMHVVEMRRPHKAKVRLWSALTAACLIVIMFAGGLQAYGTHLRIASTVELDVNPSVMMQANSVDKVLSVKAINSDGEGILDGMDLKGIDIKIAVNAVIGSMAQQGYLSDEESSILVSVSGKDEEKADTLRKEVVKNIEASLEENQVSAVVFNQQLAPTPELEVLAQEYDISNGKASFIQTLVEKDESLSLEELAALSMSEISKLIVEKEIEVEDLLETTSAAETEDQDDEIESWSEEELEEQGTAGISTEEPSEESLENNVDAGNLPETEEPTDTPENHQEEEIRPDRNPRVSILSTEQIDDIIRIEFTGSVSWRNPTVSVQDSSGAAYPAMLMETGEDYCEIYVTDLLEDGQYTFTIAGIRSRRASQFDTVIGTFIAAVPETTSPDTGISEPETDEGGNVIQLPSESEEEMTGDEREDETDEYIEDESQKESELSSEDLYPNEDELKESGESEDASEPSTEADEDEFPDDENDEDEDNEDYDDENWDDEDWDDEDDEESNVIIAVPRISITSLVYEAPDLLTLTFSREVEWVKPSFTVIDDKGNSHVVDIMEMGKRRCVLSIDTLEAGYSYTIRIAGIAEINSANTTEAVSFLTIVN